MKSISKGADISLSMIPRPKEGVFIYGMGYDADSAFTSNCVNRSWNTNLEKLDVQPENKSLEVTWKSWRTILERIHYRNYNRFLHVDISTIF